VIVFDSKTVPNWQTVKRLWKAGRRGSVSGSATLVGGHQYHEGDGFVVHIRMHPRQTCDISHLYPVIDPLPEVKPSSYASNSYCGYLNSL
jgi:hypothetical protein